MARVGVTYHEDSIRFYAEFDAEFISILKREIPRSSRKWVPAYRAWVVYRPFADDGIRLINQHYGTTFGTWRAWKDSQSEPETVPPKVPSTVERAYHTLGLLPSAEREVVLAAYRALAKKYHPDVTSEEDGQMVVINKAFQMLKTATLV